MHLNDSDRQLVQEILRRHLPQQAHVLAYGSRIHGRNLKPFSDLDLCVRSLDPLPVETLSRLSQAFEDSDLPFSVDVVDWSRLSSEFRAAISPDFEVFPFIVVAGSV